MELEHDPIHGEGFFFAEHAFRGSLYRLACSFFASAEFARLGRASDTEPLSTLVTEYQEDEISRLLVSAAASVRVIQDREGDGTSAQVASCGRLIPNISSPVPEPLTLREACNKIIHARRFNFSAGFDPFGFHTPRIWSFTTLGASPWPLLLPPSSPCIPA
jgi:hypothetical protein